MNEDIVLLVKAGRPDIFSSIEVHGYLEDLREFGRKLSVFPQKMNSKIVLSFGGEDGFFAFFLRIQVSCFDVTGKLNISIEMKDFRNHPELKEAKFSLFTHPAEINLFGKSLELWSPIDDVLLNIQFSS